MSQHVDCNALVALYPAKSWNDKDGDATKFKSEDAEYRCYKPSSKLESGVLKVTYKQDHIRNNAKDDHVNLSASFAADGSLEAMEMTWEMGDASIPDNVIKWTAKAAALTVDVIADVLSEGMAVELDPEIAKITGKVVTAVGNAYNFMCKAFTRLSDDGGRLNFMAVANHNLNKLAASVRVDGKPAPTAMVSYSASAFEKAMGTSFTHKDGQAMEYKDPASNGADYRTWTLEQSPFAQGLGIYLSTKIDHIRDNKKDDHMVVMVGYNAAGIAIQGQAGVQIPGEDDITTDVIVLNQNGVTDVATAVANAVKAKLQKTYDSSNDSRHHFPDVIKRNIQAMSAAVHATQPVASL